MTVDRIGVARRRVEWAARALGAAARELGAAGEAGLIVDGTPGRVKEEPESVGGLLAEIDAVRLSVAARAASHACGRLRGAPIS